MTEENLSDEDNIEIAKIAENWCTFWSRVVTVSRIGDAWMFESIQSGGPRHYFYGPFVNSKDNIYVDLYVEGEEEDMLVGAVQWRWNEDSYYYTDLRGQTQPLPFPAPAVHEPAEPKLEHAIIWVDYHARLEKVFETWMEYVEHWKHRDLATKIWSHGICVQNETELSMSGFTETGEPVLEIIYSVHDDDVPQIQYFEAYDTLK